MKPRSILFSAAALFGFGLLVHATLLTLGVSHPWEGWFARDEELEDEDDDPRGARAPVDVTVLERLFEENARSRAAGLGMGEPLTPGDVHEGFEYVITNLEAVADSGKRLSRKEWRASYRAANDAFAAYSIHADGQELEEAHRRLKETLARIRVRGGRTFDP